MGSSTVVLQVPSLPGPLPVYWSWSEGEPLPSGVTVARGDLPRDMKLRLGLVQLYPPKVTVDKNNVAEIHVDVEELVSWFLRVSGMTVAEAEQKCGELIRFIKTACSRLDIEINSDLPVETVTFTLPTEWKVVGILKDNSPIPYTVSDTNRFTFTLTHESPAVITIQLASELFARLINIQIDGLKLALAVVFYIFNVFDYYTTKKGLEAGLKEGNPFARSIMRMGWKKYQAVKLIGPALFTFQALASEDPNYIWTACLGIGAAMFAYAAIQNALLIAGRKVAEKTKVA